MDKIVDIPVKDPQGRLIGKASVTREDDAYHAHMVLDPELGRDMVQAMTYGTVTGLSVGVEIIPAMKENKELPSFYQGQAKYGRGPAKPTLPAGQDG